MTHTTATNTTTRPLVLEWTFQSPVSDVWQALTNHDKMKQWYFDIKAFEPVVGFEFEFDAGKNEIRFLHLCKVTEVIPEKKLSYTWRYKGYAGNTLVSFELFPEGEATRLRITHEGLETLTDFPFGVEAFDKGWNYWTGELRKFLSL